MAKAIGGKGIGRRRFLAGAGAMATAAAPPVSHLHPVRAGPGSRTADAMVFFDPVEAAFVAAAADLMIPADDLGPGAVQAGVVAFIDRQLAGAYGSGARTYLAGPWAEGTPSQGYQLPLTPAQLYRTAIAELNQAAREAHGKGFSDLPLKLRTEFLAAADAGDVGLPSVPGKLFVSMLWGNVVEGYFSDPVHGGNRGMAAWKMIGFPGARGAYSNEIEAFRGKRYSADPVSIADLQ
jgi:gluconate 2-dehydrogenase gamma chain